MLITLQLSLIKLPLHKALKSLAEKFDDCVAIIKQWAKMCCPIKLHATFKVEMNGNDKPNVFWCREDGRWLINLVSKAMYDSPPIFIWEFDSLISQSDKIAQHGGLHHALFSVTNLGGPHDFTGKFLEHLRAEIPGINTQYAKRIEIYCYCDASQIAFGTYVYLKYISEDDKIVTWFLPGLACPQLTESWQYLASKCLQLW